MDVYCLTSLAACKRVRICPINPNAEQLFPIIDPIGDYAIYLDNAATELCTGSFHKIDSIVGKAAVKNRSAHIQA